MSDINRVASAYLREYMFVASQEEKARLRLEETASEATDRYDVDDELVIVSTPPTTFVIYNTDLHRFLYGVTPTTGRPVFGGNIQNAQVFDRNGIEAGKLHGVSLPAPHFLGGAA